MLFRRDDLAVIAIPQPSHAWLSGQVIRAWGNERFDRPEPFEEACLGAEQHDIGWLEWEAEPTLDPATGLPHDFRAVGTETHTRLWRRGVERAAALGTYPALLVSLHAKTIYGYFDRAAADPAERALVDCFLAEQAAWRDAQLARLAAVPRYAGLLAPDVLETNRLLVALADRLSLELCWGVRAEVRLPAVPARGGCRANLRLTARGGDPGRLLLEPWPFRDSRLELVCEGRRLVGPFADETAMRTALDEAPPAIVAASLAPP
jgi:hypothetical protein